MLQKYKKIIISKHFFTFFRNQVGVYFKYFM